MSAGELPLGLYRDGPGPVEVALRGAVEAATGAGELGPVHAGSVGLALSLARIVDHAESRGRHTVVAVTSKELRLVIASLGLDRASRGELQSGGGASDPFDELTRAMSASASNPPPARAGD